MSKPYNRLDKNDAVVLLIDHQAGLISLVQDFTPSDFKNNVLALANSAKFFGLPTILTTSFEQGPNGPLVPELLHQRLVLGCRAQVVPEGPHTFLAQKTGHAAPAAPQSIDQYPAPQIHGLTIGQIGVCRCFRRPIQANPAGRRAP